MSRFPQARTAALLTAALLLAPMAVAQAARGTGALDPRDQWGQWRGPLATGVAPRGDPPVTWSETSNVRWKTAIPGRGLSTPVVWGGQVFLTTAVPHGDRVEPAAVHDDGAHDNVPPTRKHRFVVLAVDRESGAIRWRRTVRDQRPHEATHSTGSWASASAVTDGELLFASFGSRGLYALDLEGTVVWEKDLGDMRTRHHHGEGSSPALWGEMLVVNWDHQGESFVVALDRRTGRERWRAARDEITSWSSPLIVEHEGAVQVILAATGRTRSYDLATGEVLWEVGGLSRNVVSTPLAGDGLVYVANSYDWRKMQAIRLDRDLAGADRVAWSLDQDTPYVPSPILYGDLLCFTKHLQAMLTCVDPATGKRWFGPVRLPRARFIFASPVGAAGRIYIPNQDGVTAVLARGHGFELLAANRLDDSFSASPAVAGDELFLRGEKHLYCLSEE